MSTYLDAKNCVTTKRAGEIYRKEGKTKHDFLSYHTKQSTDPNLGEAA